MDNTKPEPLQLHSSNLSKVWMIVTDNEFMFGKSDKAKCIGQDAQDVYNTWTLSEEEQNNPTVQCC